ncbi:YdeI/OmpD-associated family protein [Dyella amyloliquefaciens]|uniref:YdeI/OmpD-associated family protein n=1 Tax=Dyella amyloliquefaciens TaxID=1770545 RepID=UPI00102EA422|nr:YdeI/OmpD-associated family protein [Dyella amyloliquefaciens]
MASRDPRVDVYIAKAAPFAQPILEHLRDVVHEACPEVEEGLKWSMPFFSYKGSLLCNMAAFKQHCSFGFWLHKDVASEAGDNGMGQFGKIGTLKDLPTQKTLVAHVKKAMSLIDGGVKPKRNPSAKPPAVVPDDLAAAFVQRKHAASRKTFEGFPPGAQREYIDWINEAKTDATRQKRLVTTLEWLAEGKRRNWKYESC